MLTGERGLPITSALRFSCFSIKVTHGVEVSPETAEKLMSWENAT